MNILPASVDSFTAAIALLKKNGLPTEDVTAGTQLFVMEEENEVVGTIAVEYDYENALLRSLCVSKDKQKHGTGSLLVNFIEDYVRKQGVQQIYLLTTTAAGFFSKRGYTIIDRKDVPASIKGSAQFRSLCPATATLMKKQLM
jgi:amino-acid N-acetyltransferase